MSKPWDFSRNDFLSPGVVRSVPQKPAAAGDLSLPFEISCLENEIMQREAQLRTQWADFWWYCLKPGSSNARDLIPITGILFIWVNEFCYPLNLVWTFLLLLLLATKRPLTHISHGSVITQQSVHKHTFGLNKWVLIEETIRVLYQVTKIVYDHSPPLWSVVIFLFGQTCVSIL